MTPSDTQARFFTNLQQLLVEGTFVSTYKYALLISLARWAVENANYDERVPLDVGQLTTHYLSLYWPHVQPFGVARTGLEVAEASARYRGGEAGSWAGVLNQDRGGQTPRILKLIRSEQEAGCAHMRDLPHDRRASLSNAARASIRDMPLWKLQVVATGQESPFLYRRGGTSSEIVFEPGVVGCLAEFAVLVEHVVRAAWLRFVLRANHRLLGSPAAQLEDFLFPSSRAALSVWRPALQELQGNECFYCGREMGIAHVDHFLPWSRYPRDLGHNFVLADEACNNAKSDHLASLEHLEKWFQRNDEDGEQLAQRFEAERLPHDWQTLRRVTGSLYGVAEHAGALVWQEKKQFVALGAGWRHLVE